LNGWNGCDQIAVGDGFEQVEIIFAGGPGSERNKGRLQGEVCIVAEVESAEEISPGVTLFQFQEDLVVERFDGAGDEQAAGTSERGQSVRLAKKVSDLDGGVVGEQRMLSMQSFDNAGGVRDAVEEIGIAEGDVLGTRLDLLANVGEDDFLRDDSELAVVDRNNWAMAAEMFAAARSFGVTGGAVVAGWENDVGVFL
jgi:hypothetical protein